MKEADFKRMVVKQFKTLGHYARRIEDQYNVGFPDLILIPKDYPVFFTEAKIVRGLRFGPSERQFVELSRLAISKYSVPCVLGFDGNNTYLHPWAQECMLTNCVQQRDDETLVDFFKRFYHEKGWKYE